MSDTGGTDEWWKQYSGEGVGPDSPGSGGNSAAGPGYPSYPSVPQYPSTPAAPAMGSAPSYGNSMPASSPAPGPAPVAPMPVAQAPYQPYGFPRDPGTNPMAIASLIVSIANVVIGITLCGLTLIGGIVGTILGMVALNQLNRSGQNGRGMALAGIWIGVAATVVWIIGLVFVVVIGISAPSY